MGLDKRKRGLNRKGKKKEFVVYGGLAKDKSVIIIGTRPRLGNCGGQRKQKKKKKKNWMRLER